MLFGQFPTETQNVMQQAAAHPYDPTPPDAGFFTGVGKGISQGYETGGAQLLMAGSDAIAGINKSIGGQPNQSLTDLHEGSADLINSLQPDPHTVGFAGRVLGGLSEIAPELGAAMLPGGQIPAAAAAGAQTGYSDFRMGERQGLDPVTAGEKGAISGVTTGAGLLLPVGIGTGALTKIGTGAAGQVAFGAGSREATSALLTARGYPDMAQQYKPLDKASLLADGVMGAVFGGSAALHDHLSPSAVDAAMTAKSNQNLEVDSAPGVPLTPETRTDHLAAMKTATDQLLRGDPVDLSQVINHDMHFSIDPASQMASSYHDFSDALRKAGFDDQADDISDKIEQSERNFSGRSAKLQEVQAKFDDAQTTRDELNNQYKGLQDQLSSPLSQSDKISLVDPVSGDRLKSIESELDDQSIAPQRRAELEQQWNLVVNGRDWKEIPQAVEDRNERLQSQASDLEGKISAHDKDIARFEAEIAKRQEKLTPKESTSTEKPQTGEQVKVKDEGEISTVAPGKGSEKPAQEKDSVENLVSENPDRRVVTGELDKDGNPEVVSAKEALEREDNADQQNDLYKKVVDAAINCFAKWG